MADAEETWLSRAVQSLQIGGGGLGAASTVTIPDLARLVKVVHDLMAPKRIQDSDLPDLLTSFAFGQLVLSDGLDPTSSDEAERLWAIVEDVVHARPGAETAVIAAAERDRWSLVTTTGFLLEAVVATDLAVGVLWDGKRVTELLLQRWEASEA